MYKYVRNICFALMIAFVAAACVESKEHQILQEEEEKSSVTEVEDEGGMEEEVDEEESSSRPWYQIPTTTIETTPAPPVTVHPDGDYTIGVVDPFNRYGPEPDILTDPIGWSIWTNLNYYPTHDDLRFYTYRDYEEITMAACGMFEEGYDLIDVSMIIIEHVEYHMQEPLASYVGMSAGIVCPDVFPW